MSIAFVFPGQGSQSIGMLDALAQQFPVVQQTFAEASAVVDKDLWKIVVQGPEAAINATENTQPIMLAAGVACWRVWQAQQGLAPAIMAGHSLGEYTALVCSGALNYSDAVALVRDRAIYMQQAVPVGEGAMAAILGMDDQAVVSLCEHCAEGEVLSAVNYNSPGQVVVAGTAKAVDRLLAQAPEAGAKRAIKLAVSVPSHCALMHTAAEQLAQRLQQITIAQAAIPVLHNTNVQVEHEADQIRAALAKQVVSPVRWVETIQKIEQTIGGGFIVECAPGKVLTGLNKRITKTLKTLPAYDPTSFERALAATG